MNKKCIGCEFSRQCVTVKQINPSTCLKDDNEKSMNNDIKNILEYVLSLTYGNENAIKGINKVKDYITNLQEENVVLKSQLLQDNKSYYDMQDRIDKAIEKLKDLYSYADNEEYVDNYCKDLLKTLQGKSDE